MSQDSSYDSSIRKSSTESVTRNGSSTSLVTQTTHRVSSGPSRRSHQPSVRSKNVRISSAEIMGPNVSYRQEEAASAATVTTTATKSLATVSKGSKSKQMPKITFSQKSRDRSSSERSDKVEGFVNNIEPPETEEISCFSTEALNDPALQMPSPFLNELPMPSKILQQEKARVEVKRCPIHGKVTTYHVKATLNNDSPRPNNIFCKLCFPDTDPNGKTPKSPAKASVSASTRNQSRGNYGGSGDDSGQSVDSSTISNNSRVKHAVKSEKKLARGKNKLESPRKSHVAETTDEASSLSLDTATLSHRTRHTGQSRTTNEKSLPTGSKKSESRKPKDKHRPSAIYDDSSAVVTSRTYSTRTRTREPASEPNTGRSSTTAASKSVSRNTKTTGRTETTEETGSMAATSITTSRRTLKTTTTNEIKDEDSSTTAAPRSVYQRKRPARANPSTGYASSASTTVPMTSQRSCQTATTTEFTEDVTIAATTSRTLSDTTSQAITSPSAKTKSIVTSMTESAPTKGKHSYKSSQRSSKYGQNEAKDQRKKKTTERKSKSTCKEEIDILPADELNPLRRTYLAHMSLTGTEMPDLNKFIPPTNLDGIFRETDGPQHGLAPVSIANDVRQHGRPSYTQADELEKTFRISRKPVVESIKPPRFSEEMAYDDDNLSQLSFKCSESSIASTELEEALAKGVDPLSLKHTSNKSVHKISLYILRDWRLKRNRLQIICDEFLHTKGVITELLSEINESMHAAGLMEHRRNTLQNEVDELSNELAETKQICELQIDKLHKLSTINRELNCSYEKLAMEKEGAMNIMNNLMNTFETLIDNRALSNERLMLLTEKEEEARQLCQSFVDSLSEIEEMDRNFRQNQTYYTEQLLNVSKYVDYFTQNYEGISELYETYKNRENELENYITEQHERLKHVSEETQAYNAKRQSWLSFFNSTNLFMNFAQFGLSVLLPSLPQSNLYYYF